MMSGISVIGFAGNLVVFMSLINEECFSWLGSVAVGEPVKPSNSCKSIAKLVIGVVTHVAQGSKKAALAN